MSPAQPEEFNVPERLVGSVYSVIAARRTAFDTLMWQVPLLGLAAQAFLLTIAYGASSSSTARVVAGTLSLVVATVAIQTMLKHRANEKTDSLILKEIERTRDIRLTLDASPHDSPRARGRAMENELIDGYLARRGSARLWILSLSGFAVAGAVAIVLTLYDATLLATG